MRFGQLEWYNQLNYRYEGEKVGLSVRKEIYGIALTFQKQVEVTSSQFNIDALTLLTKIGGILGVGRTIVWIIITCFDYILYFQNLCTIYKF